jgi:hypothetical protein
MNPNERAAAIEMGRHPEQLRKALTETEHFSLLHLYDQFCNIPKDRPSPRLGNRPTKTAAGTLPRQRGRPKTDQAAAAAAAIAARGETPTRTNVMREAGVGEHAAQSAVEGFHTAAAVRAEIDEEALAKAAEAALPKSTKEKNDIWRRHELKRLEREFEERVRAQSQDNDEKLWKPYYNEKLQFAETVVAGRDGVFTKAQFKQILACLHPDHVATLGDDWVKRHNEAFRLFREAEIKLVDESESRVMGGRPWTIQ